MSPQIVAFVRGIATVSVGAAIAAAIAFATSPPENLGDAWWLVPLLAGLRWAEGWYDQHVRNQAPQDGIRGGRPASPDAYLPNPNPSEAGYVAPDGLEGFPAP